MAFALTLWDTPLPGVLYHCTDRASGWRAYLFAARAEAEDGALVIVYCPECAEREFGEEPG